MELHAKKSLGQHFLTSKHVLEQIITAANVQKGEIVLEIGPGTGILTEELMKSGARVLAVEKDVRAFDLLVNKFSDPIKNEQLKLIHGDILDETSVLKEIAASLHDSPFAIVANIPYYITGAILEQFLENEPRPCRMILLVQKEVAERIVARDGKESVLSISVKAFGTPRIISNVPKGAFSPPPTVDSAIISIQNISDIEQNIANTDLHDIARFFAIVKAGFAHKRKYLIKNLETVLSADALKKIWETLGLDLKIRAENLKVDQWVKIADM